MIKEKKKHTKFNRNKTKKQIIKDYIKTILLSCLLGFIFTTGLAMHARNEMIKNLYKNNTSGSIIDKQLAEKLISENNFFENLSLKDYKTCMYAGDLYVAIEDYQKAQHAYELAIEKCPIQRLNIYYKLLCTLINQGKFDKANSLLSTISDHNDKQLLKFKTRSYIVIGDKYYSIGKFLSAANNYQNAEFYYNKFSKKDAKVTEAIKERMVNSYLQAADLLVKNGMNSDAVRFLKSAENTDPENYNIKYKLAIVLSDVDPEKSVDYFEFLLDKIPQQIDYNIYGRALMKSANIADLDNRPTKAKYYRYKIHSNDLFVNRKVVYRDDFNVICSAIKIKKVLFTYPLSVWFQISNNSATDIINLTADVALVKDDKIVERITVPVASRDNPLYSNEYNNNEFNAKFKKNIFTRKELDNYNVEVFLYKDKKYKTLVTKIKIPQKSFKITSKKS